MSVEPGAQGLSIELDQILGPPQRGRQPNGTPHLLKLRTPHHELARLLALGYRDFEVAQMTGYSQVRISVLKRDPMFQELVDVYMTRRDSVVVDMTQRLQGLAVQAVEILQERLDENADALSVKELHSVAELSLDRVGYGKSSTVNLNAGVSPKTLDQIKEAVRAGARGRVVERGQDEQESQRSPLGSDVRAALVHPTSPASSGDEGGGSQV